ncbi:hypothetical protein Pcinc_012925 [Petrolisthes cinctipes]|uniref:Uncharacterized protein n=1 Tax=Petrolisthes cinctipes TaxID=88211 RepID=A0AAE1FY25_PETCI|nr:hypothetical protein Pcinc_012925 [Petrolisthes cinctipes]
MPEAPLIPLPWALAPSPPLLSFTHHLSSSPLTATLPDPILSSPFPYSPLPTHTCPLFPGRPYPRRLTPPPHRLHVSSFPSPSLIGTLPNPRLLSHCLPSLLHLPFSHYTGILPFISCSSLNLSTS